MQRGSLSIRSWRTQCDWGYLLVVMTQTAKEYLACSWQLTADGFYLHTVFLTSANAAAETGELVNIDGTGNRISGSLFGHRKVYFVIGVNKICPTLDNAIFRARNVAAPKNVERHHYKNGCSFFNYKKCCDCSAPDRICNALVIYYKKMRNMDMEVVIINEELGL